MGELISLQSILSIIAVLVTVGGLYVNWKNSKTQALALMQKTDETHTQKLEERVRVLEKLVAQKEDEIQRLLTENISLMKRLVLEK